MWCPSRAPAKPVGDAGPSLSDSFWGWSLEKTQGEREKQYGPHREPWRTLAPQESTLEGGPDFCTCHTGPSLAEAGPGGGGGPGRGGSGYQRRGLDRQGVWAGNPQPGAQL